MRLLGINLTTGRETEAVWGGGHGLSSSTAVSGVSGGFHFIVRCGTLPHPTPHGAGGKKTRLVLPRGASPAPGG